MIDDNLIIRDVTESDFENIVRLNDSAVQFTSEMDPDHLAFLVSISGYCRIAIHDGQLAAFLIGLRESAPYENDNYRFFTSRFSSFLYVDRIVVDAQFAGRNIGSKMYEDLFEFARTHGVNVVTCEYNIEPLNAISRAFHNKFGFKELGTQWVAGGGKKVSLQAAQV